MVLSFSSMMSVDQLNKLAHAFASDLIASSPKTPRLLNFQITLLEVFSREIKKYDALGYCDYELAYLSYRVVSGLCAYCEKQDSTEVHALIDGIRSTITKKATSVKALVNFLNESSMSGNDVDPLLARLASLKGLNGTSGPKTLSSADNYKYKETITPDELNGILNDPSLLVLLIDFRSSKEFNYSHINYAEIVNIEPSHISTLMSKKEYTDMDLEDRLKMHLPEDQVQRFQKRHKYDLVVIYNLRYGSSVNDRFQALKDLIINDDKSGIPSSNPFQGLIDIITYKPKYISSRLKQHPLYLSGGLVNWHLHFGDESLKKGTPSILSRPPASLSRGGSVSPSTSRSNSFSLKSIPPPSTSPSPYLRNFGDYLSTAKSATSNPVPASYVEPVSTSLSKINVHSYGKPAELAPPPQQLIPPQQPVPKRTLSNGSSLPSVNRSRSNSVLTEDPAVVPASPPRLPPKKSLSTASNPSKFLEQYATGLTNLGNSCYMNCVLQCLGATPQLTRFFFPTISTSATEGMSLQSYRQHINVNNKLGTKGILTTNFVSLLANMFNNSGKYFTPQNFKKVVGSLSPGQQFASFDQQDCIEFLNFILDGLHEDLNQMIIDNPEEKKAITELTPEQEKTREVLPVRLASTIEWERYLKLNFSIIVDFFQGQYLSHLKCLECGLTSTTYNAFSILSLPIPEKLSGYLQKVTLDDCLKEFTTTELLDENNKWHCPRCKRFTRLTKKISITRLPEVLIIHFKRFEMNSGGYISKKESFVTYPVDEVLDLTSYWPEVGTSLNSNGDSAMDKAKEQQILSTLPSRNQQSPFRYKLYGVVEHFGNLSTGHYTSYVHKQSDNKKTRGWCYFDDAKVTYNCKPSQVLNKNAYCLFYQRIYNK